MKCTVHRFCPHTIECLNKNGCTDHRHTIAAASLLNPKQRYGDLKPNVALNPGSAAAYQALAHEDGARKYGPFNWREKAIELMTYVAAAKRHLDAWVDGEDFSVDTVEAGAPVHNLGHVMASVAILIDAIETPGCAVDNRPKAGGSSTVHERVKAERKATAASNPAAGGTPI